MKFKDNDEVRDYIVSEVFINGNMSDLALEKFYKKLKKPLKKREKTLDNFMDFNYNHITLKN